MIIKIRLTLDSAGGSKEQLIPKQNVLIHKNTRLTILDELFFFALDYKANKHALLQ